MRYRLTVSKMTGPTMCPMCDGLYTVGPHTYIVTASPGFLWNGSFLRVSVLYTCSDIRLLYSS